MTTGEFEFDTIFINEQDLVDDGLELLFPTLTTILLIIFIVTMPILFNNLLVCYISTIGRLWLAHIS